MAAFKPFAARMPSACHARFGVKTRRGKLFSGFKLNLNFVWYTSRAIPAMGAGCALGKMDGHILV